MRNVDAQSIEAMNKHINECGGSIKKSVTLNKHYSNGDQLTFACIRLKCAICGEEVGFFLIYLNIPPLLDYFTETEVLTAVRSGVDDFIKINLNK